MMPSKADTFLFNLNMSLDIYIKLDRDRCDQPKSIHIMAVWHQHIFLPLPFWQKHPGS